MPDAAITEIVSSSTTLKYSSLLARTGRSDVVADAPDARNALMVTTTRYAPATNGLLVADDVEMETIWVDPVTGMPTACKGYPFSSRVAVANVCLLMH